MALVFSADLSKLPVEPVSRWLALRDLMEQRLSHATDIREGAAEEDLVEYCTVLVSAAEELGLGKFSEFSVLEIRRHFPELRSEIISLATKLGMRSATSNAALSVSLRRPAREKLLRQIDRLRTLTASSDLSEKVKDDVYKKLDELQSLVMEQRTDFAKVMSVVGWVAAAIFGTTTFLAEAPDAISTIAAIIGEAKREEEEEHTLLIGNQTVPQLEDLRERPPLDDEIPF